MLRRLKKFTVYSSAIVAGQASRALDDAPFAGQDESEDAKGLLRQLSECDDASYVQIFGNCYHPVTTYLRAPPRPRRPARRATAPRRRRSVYDNIIDGTIPTEIGLLPALEYLRVPSASPTPGAPRDRPSASQGPLRQRDRWPDPERDRPAHGADGPASSPRVPDARRGARQTLGVAGASTATRSPARSRPRSASSRR